MNVWEKVNIGSALVGAASLLVFGGYAIPRPADEPPAPVSVVEQVADSPLPGGMTEDALLDDAWLSYEELDLRAEAAEMGLLPEYVGSFQNRVPGFPDDHFTVQSLTDPSIMHAFRYVPLTEA